MSEKPACRVLRQHRSTQSKLLKEQADVSASLNIKRRYATPARLGPAERLAAGPARLRTFAIRQA